MSTTVSDPALQIQHNRHEEVLEALERADQGLTIRDLVCETNRSPSQVCSALVELRDAGEIRQYRGVRDVRRYRFEPAGTE